MEEDLCTLGFYTRSICRVCDVGGVELAAGVVKDTILILEC